MYVDDADGGEDDGCGGDDDDDCHHLHADEYELEYLHATSTAEV